jgi:hypothetical protein
MGRITYVCATCSEHFTRKYSATRHNLTIHDGRGEIVRLLEYLAGTLSGRYLPSHPSWYRRNQKWETRTAHNSDNKSGLAIFADSEGDTFRPGNGLQVETRGPNNSTDGPMHKTVDQPYGTQSQERRLKIIELRTLLDKHYVRYGDIILRRALYESNKGDENYIDEKLAWVRKIDKVRNRLSNTGISITDRSSDKELIL